MKASRHSAIALLVASAFAVGAPGSPAATKHHKRHHHHRKHHRKHHKTCPAGSSLQGGKCLAFQVY